MTTTHKDEFVHLDFVVVGSRKCATTWLYELLLEHPQVCVSSTVKQSGFFTKYYERGLSWYTKLYCNWQNRIVGEVDPDIITCSDGPSRIYALFPSAKIIAIFRNPPDLFFSSYEHAKRKGDTYKTPEQVWNEDGMFRSEVGYGTLLQNIYSVFPTEQVLTLFYEDIDRDTTTTLLQIGNFLGLTSGFDTQKASNRVNASRKAINPLLSKLFSKSARIARRFGFHALVNRVKKTSFAQNNYNQTDRKELNIQRSGSLRIQIIRDIQSELRLFQELSGKDIAEVWPEACEFLGSNDGNTTS